MKSNITLLIKSFLRKDCVERLIDSIRARYPTIPIVIVDDSGYAVNYSRDENITTYNIPFDSGLSAGRNYGVSKITTPYFILLDDDFEFTDETDLERFYDIFRASKLDILGGYVREPNGSFLEYFGNFHYNETERTITSERVAIPENQLFVKCNLVLNFFIAKTSKIRKYPWDNKLKLAEHSAFFFVHRDKLKVGYTDQISIFHHRVQDPDYQKYRIRGSAFFKQWLVDNNITAYTNLTGRTLYQSKYAENKLTAVSGGTIARPKELGNPTLTASQLKLKLAELQKILNKRRQ